MWRVGSKVTRNILSGFFSYTFFFWIGVASSMRYCRSRLCTPFDCIRTFLQIFRANEQSVMSSNLHIRTPFLLATLPKPLNSVKYQTICNRVYGRKQRRTRKRPELVVGIKGEAVNIYDVRYGASYSPCLFTNLGVDLHFFHHNLISPITARLFCMPSLLNQDWFLHRR